METPKAPPVNPRDVPQQQHAQQPRPAPLTTDKPVTLQDTQNMQQMPQRSTSVPAAPVHPVPDPAARRHRVYMDDPKSPADPNAVVGLPLTTVQALLRQLGDLQVTVNRQPLGPGQFGMEIIMLQNKLATPGFNPTPQDVDDINHQVQDLAERVAGLDVPYRDPLWVTEGDVDQRFADVTATANRLPSPQKEVMLHDIQMVRQRKANMQMPYNQPNLDALNTEVLELSKRVEAEAGRHSV